MTEFPLDIVTPDGKIFSGRAESLRLRSIEGQPGNHAEATALHTLETLNEAVDQAGPTKLAALLDRLLG